MTADALVRQHADLVYRVALRVTGTSDDAADAAQDALVKVWRGIVDIEPERRRAWAARVARNAALDLLRRRAVRPQPGAADPIREPTASSPLPDAHTEASEMRTEIARCLDRLDEPYRSILVLREIEGLAYAEIAESLDLPLNTLKVYLLRARRRFRAALAASAPELVP
ncbi:MAG: sigma-70 family RNA polymerase sigma factor [Bacteroidota bacterium]